MNRSKGMRVIYQNNLQVDGRFLRFSEGMEVLSLLVTAAAPLIRETLRGLPPESYVLLVVLSDYKKWGRCVQSQILGNWDGVRDFQGSELSPEFADLVGLVRALGFRPVARDISGLGINGLCLIAKRPN